MEKLTLKDLTDFIERQPGITQNTILRISYECGCEGDASQLYYDKEKGMLIIIE